LITLFPQSRYAEHARVAIARHALEWRDAARAQSLLQALPVDGASFLNTEARRLLNQTLERVAREQAGAPPRRPRPANRLRLPAPAGAR
jgi:hypothetical protein